MRAVTGGWGREGQAHSERQEQEKGSRLGWGWGNSAAQSGQCEWCLGRALRLEELDLLRSQSHRDLLDKFTEQASINICMSCVYSSFKFSRLQALPLVKPLPSLAVCLNPLVLPASQSPGHGPSQQFLLCSCPSLRMMVRWKFFMPWHFFFLFL